MFPIIDMHCDTISGILFANRKGKELSLRENNMHIDLLRMKQAGYMCQSFALFTPLKPVIEAGESPFDHCMALSDTFDREIAANADLIRPVTTAAEMTKNHRNGLLSALKTVEEGGVYEGKVENLEKLYKKGVRKSTLTWNFENELAFPNRFDPASHSMTPDTERGLKPAGFEMIHAMEDMGVIIDVSHLNDAGIRDILDTVRKDTPVIASHSNARGECGHARNLTDEFLKEIAEHGGITGINFCDSFLAEGQNDGPSRISDMIRHMKYIRNTAGIDVIGLGTDFDGIGSKLEINGCGEMQKLADAMSIAGFTDGEIEKVFYQNALRVYSTVLK